MDWLQIALFLLVFVFPLLQGLLARRAPAPPDPLVIPPPTHANPAAAQPSAWDELFGAEALPETEAIAEAVPADTEPLEVVSLETAPTRDETAQAEPVQVDRTAEHDRFHQRYLTPDAPLSPQRSLAAHLQNPWELRRAVVLAEVLGPPRSLQ